MARKKGWDSFISLQARPLCIFFLVSALAFYHGWNAGRSYGGNSATQDGIAAQVVTIHDGDTVSVRMGQKTEKIRLIGIDAPEVGQRPWGERSKRHLADLIGTAEVTVVTDIRKRDRYGRLLAYLWSWDGRLVNLEMVREGYAVIYTIPPNVRHADELKAAQKEAREKKRGIWAAGGLMESPRDYREAHPRR